MPSFRSTSKSFFSISSFALALTLGLLGGSSAGNACSAFLYPSNDQVWVGRNFDWPMTHGFITVNKRNLRRISMPIYGQKRARWISKYGSVSFNEIARGLPQGGINEAGLMVDVLQVDNTSYPPNDSRATVSELEWIQYQLDNYSSVDEMINHIEDVRIKKLIVGVHYFACDRHRKCASFEPLNGRIEISTMSSVPVLTNDSYADSYAYAQDFLRNDSCAKVPAGIASLDRFARAACSVKRISESSKKPKVLEGIYGVLDEIADPKSTAWSFAYNLTEGTVYIRTKIATGIKKVRVKDLDYSCKSGSVRLDINNPSTGDVTGKLDHDGSFENPKTGNWNPLVGLAHLPDAIMEGIVGMTNGTDCME